MNLQFQDKRTRKEKWMQAGDLRRNSFFFSLMGKTEDQNKKKTFREMIVWKKTVCRNNTSEYQFAP